MTTHQPQRPTAPHFVAAFVLFAATIPAANWMIGNVGDCSIGPCVVHVGLGLHAPSGVVMIGITLVLRDWVHEFAGWKAAVLAVVVGAAMSAAFSPALALASGTAFLFSELADLAVYSRLRKQGRALAVALSGAAGSLIDSALFLALAFGSLDFMAGNVLGKLYASAAVASYLWWRRK